jgi:hypothetical protein
VGLIIDQQIIGKFVIKDLGIKLGRAGQLRVAQQ